MTNHIVVVDDAPPTLRLTSTIVAHIENVLVHPFPTLADALVWSAHNGIDAFVLDHGVAATDSLEMVQLLRADARFALVPIVIISAEAELKVRLAVLAAGANDFIERPVEPRELIARLTTLLGLHNARVSEATRVGILEEWLQQDHARLSRQTERFASLWRIANNADLSEIELVQEILDQSTAALRSGQFFTSSLSRLDGDSIVVEARSFDPDVYAPTQSTPVGTRLPLEDALQKIPLRSGKTQWWDDIMKDPVAAQVPRVRSAASRATICTPFTVKGKTYFLTYWSREPVAEPFGKDDATYVELVAMFFAVRLQQSWQSSRIDYHVSHDALTGLRNRMQFRLDARTLYNAQHCGAVAVVDIAGFRHVNERYGHIIGDALLVEVGEALEKHVTAMAREGAIAARLAGDTFGVFLPGVASHQDALDAMAPFADLLNGAFASGELEGRDVIPLEARFGVAWSADPDAQVDELITHANTALHAAKRHEAGRTEIFERGMESEDGERLRLIGELSLALARNEFELFYQPQIDLASQRVTGAEALIRWHHPTRGTLLPEAFIPFAERNSLIGAVSSWVIGQAIVDAQSFGSVERGIRLYLNLSALDLADLNVVIRLQRASDEGARLNNLGVEFTETAALHDVAVTTQIVNLLHTFDVAVALDDFGAGYSSFGLLKRLAVDIVKIDHSFVREILANPDDAAITDAVIGVSRHLGSVTVAKGVETPEEETWLRERGCGYAQGYGIAKPLPVGDFLAWLRARESARSAPDDAPIEAHLG